MSDLPRMPEGEAAEVIETADVRKRHVEEEKIFRRWLAEQRRA